MAHHAIQPRDLGTDEPSSVRIAAAKRAVIRVLARQAARALWASQVANDAAPCPTDGRADA